MLGILMGASSCGGQQTQPTSKAGPPSDVPHKEKASCGNHEPGKCASVDSASTSPSAADKPLTISRKETVAPGKAMEINLSFRSASKVRATFQASGPVA